MTKEQIALAVITIVLVPLTVNIFKRLRELEECITRAETFIKFLQTYMLKEAVLQFRSNPNPDTDKIIDKIQNGEPVTEQEAEQLREKIQKIADNAPDPQKQSKAQNTLELMDKIFDWQASIKRASSKRNDLFNE